MKFNGLIWHIWFISMLLIGFCFISTTYFFDLLYQERIEKQYVSDYEDIILDMENTLESNEQVSREYVQNWNTSHKHISMALYIDDKLQTPALQEIVSNRADYDDTITAAIQQAIETNKDSRDIGYIKTKKNPKTPYILSVKHVQVDGNDNAFIVSFAGFSFLDDIQGNMHKWAASLFVLYGLLAVLFYLFLKKRLGEPLNELKDIAFDYAVNDFSRQAPVEHKDELSQLSMAMNKMAKSLETTGTATRQEKELLANIVSSISTGILYYNQDKTLLLSNPSGVEFLEHADKEQTAVELHVPDFLKSKIDEVIRISGKVEFEYTADDWYYEVSLIPLFDEDLTSVRGVLVSVQNITKERRLDKMRVDFINNISHELRTPLVMIQGYSEAIVDDVAESRDEKNEMAQIIGEESKRMNRMVNEMLDLSRMEAGYIQLFKEEVDLKAFFTQLLSRFHTMASNGGITLSLEIETGLTSYFMDKDKMDQVFVNLINNAIRHTIMGQKEEGSVKVWVHFDHLVDDILIEIIDNGTGIPEKDVPYIFDRFYKADKSRATQSSNRIGTGIGLSLVKSIVEAHEGFVDIKSKESQGATFRVHLPYVEENEQINDKGRD